MGGRTALVATLAWIVVLARVGSTSAADIPTWVDFTPNGVPNLGRFLSAVDPVTSRMYLHARSTFPDGRDETFVIRFDVVPPRAERIGAVGPPPPPRDGAAMVFDPGRGRLLLLGGVSGSTTFDETEVWQLQLGAVPRWTRLAPLGPAPSARAAFAAAFDPNGDRVVLHGGVTDNDPLDETWVLDLDPAPRWRCLVAAGAQPPLAMGATFVRDARRDRLVLLGGRIGPLGSRRDTWTLTLRDTPTWSHLPVSPALPAGTEDFSAAAADSAGDRIFAFVSVSGQPLKLHALDLGAARWSAVDGGGVVPAPHAQASIAVMPARNQFVVFGTVGPGSVSIADLFGLDLADLQWTNLEPAGTMPRANLPASGAFDATNRRAIVLVGAPTPETWILDLEPAPAWRRALPATPVPSVGGLPAVHDPLRGRVLVYEGASGRMWVLDADPRPSWSLLATGNIGPSSRTFYSFVADPARDRVLVYGGFAAGANLGDLWELRLGTDPPLWTLLASAAPPAPPVRNDAWLVVDPVKDRLVLSGGRGLPNTPHLPPGVWTWPLATDSAWTVHPLRGEFPLHELQNALFVNPVSTGFLLAGPTATSGQRLWSLVVDDSATWTPLEVRDAAQSNPASRGYLDAAGERIVFPDGAALHLGPLLEPVACPASGTVSRGSIESLTFALADRTGASTGYEYTLTSAREWPGFPFTGLFRTTGSITNHVPLGIAVPDTAAAGGAEFILSVRASGADAAVSCSFTLGVTGAAPPPPPPAGASLAFAADQANPLRAGTRIRFEAPAAGEVRLEGFDVAGRRRFVLHHVATGAGSQSIDLAGAVRPPAGLYFLRLTQGAFRAERTIVILP